MDDWPSLASLARVERGRLCALLDEHGTPAWQTADYQFAWERERATWEAVGQALRRAARGGRLAPANKAAPPAWLSTLVRHEWAAGSTRFHAGPGFRRSRLLERLELVTAKHDETWVLAAISGLAALDDQLSSWLRDDVEVREELVWRLFDVEGAGEVSLANVDRFAGDPWRRAFLDLTADGTLPRDRVLDGCLAALSRDFNHYRASWFTATWLALEPTDTERASRRTALLPLLRAEAAPVVSFAVKQLQAVHRHGGLDPVATVPALLPATQARAKGTALAALRLGAALASDEPAVDVRPLARSALAHEHPDVQAAGAKALADLGDAADVAAAAGQLSPRVRDDLGLSDPAVAPTPDIESSILPAITPLAPADVVDRLAELLEDAGDPGAVEGLLAALARPDAPALSPVLKRARGVLRRHIERRERGLGPTGVRATLARLVLAQAGETVPPVALPTPTLEHLSARFREVEEILRGERPPRALLATPDLPGGFVSAPALADRLDTEDRSAPHDLTAALLRLEGPVDGLPEWVRRRCAGLPAPLAGPAGRSSLTTTVREFSWTETDGTRRTGRYLAWDLVTPDVASSGGPAAVTATPVHDVLADWLGLLAIVCPHDAEHFAAIAHHSVLNAAAHSEIYHDAARVLDVLATHAGRHGPLAHTVLAAGLAANRGDQRVHAADAFTDLVGSGRVDPVLLGGRMAELSPGLRLGRWADSLRRAASSAGPGPVVDVLTAALPGMDRGQAGISTLVELLLDESLRVGRTPADARLHAWLESWSGGSKAARAARRLLEP